MVLDLVVEKGNPADSTLAVRSAERHAVLFGAVPQRAAFDGGFASKANLEALQSSGTREACFSKPVGLPVDQMTSTPRVRRILKRFRAGIEATVSFLKRSFGLSRCTWTGWPRFRAYAWCSTVAHNLERYDVLLSHVALVLYPKVDNAPGPGKLLHGVHRGLDPEGRAAVSVDEAPGRARVVGHPDT